MFRHKQVHPILRWLPVLAWVALIYWLSDQPQLDSPISGAWGMILRKLAHLIEYGVLTVFIIRAIAGDKIPRQRTVIIAVIVSILYAMGDEIHQIFVDGRRGSGVDVLIDGFGAMLASIIYTRWRSRRK